MNPHHRPRSFARLVAALIATALIVVTLVAGDAREATAAVPAGYAAATGWSVSATTGSARLPGNGSDLGTVTTTAPLQLMVMPSPAAPVDGVAVPRVDLTAAQIAAGRTACLNGATPGSTRECNGETNKRSTITFPEPVVDPVIAVVSKGAVYTSGGTTPAYCSTAWMNFTVLTVNGSPVAPGQVTAPTVSAAQRFVGGALIYDPTLMTPTARQCVDPTQGGGVSYLKISGVVTSLYIDSEYRAAVTRNTSGTTTRIAPAPPGWQFQPSVPTADLSVTASAPASVAASGQIEWTYTVRNAGTGPSHGFEITSVMPAGVTGVTVVSGGVDCTVNAGVLRCSQTPPDCIVVTQNVGDTWASLLCFDEVSPVPAVVAAGASATPIVVRATVAAGAASPLINRVTVSGADVDLTPANNSAQASSAIATPAVGITARVTPTGPAPLRAGDPLAYVVEVTNVGTIAVSAATVSRTAFSGTGAPPAVTCPAGSIAVGATIACSGAYALTQADVDRGSVTLSVTSSATSAVGAAPPSAVATATTTITRAASLGLVTRAVPSEVSAIGQTVSYSFDVTNTGTVTLTAPTVSRAAFNGAGIAPIAACPQGAILPGATVTCTSTYDVVAADAVLGALEITATASADPPVGATAPALARSSLAIPMNVPAAALTLTQSMVPTDGSTIARGGAVAFALSAANTGGRPMDAVVTADLSEVLTAAELTGDPVATIDGAPAGVVERVGTTITWAGRLPIGRTLVLTYDMAVLSTAPGGSYSAVAQATGTPQGEPALLTDEVTSTFVVAAPQPAIDIVAEASPVGPGVMRAGDPIVYSVDVTNTGDIAVAGASVVGTSFSGSPPPFTCPAAPVQIGATVTCLGDYVLTQSDIDAGLVTLSVLASATSVVDDIVAQDAASASTTITRVPSLELVKTADTAEIVAVGEAVAFAFDVTNTGNVTLTEVEIIEVAFGGAGATPLATCPAGALAPGAAVRCTASYTVAPEDAVSASIDNAAIATASAPSGVPSPASARSSVSIPVVVPAAALTLQQSMSPEDGSVVARGGTVSFTLIATNTGGRPVDLVLSADLSGLAAGAVYNDDAAISGGSVAAVLLAIAAAAPVFDGDIIAWSGPLAPGAQVVLTYSATVLPDAEPGVYSTSGDARGTPFGAPGVVSDQVGSAFVVAARADPGPDEPGTPEPTDGSPALPGTGLDSAVVGGALALALLLLAAGILSVLLGRRRTT